MRRFRPFPRNQSGAHFGPFRRAASHSRAVPLRRRGHPADPGSSAKGPPTAAGWACRAPNGCSSHSSVPSSRAVALAKADTAFGSNYLQPAVVAPCSKRRPPSGRSAPLRLALYLDFGWKIKTFTVNALQSSRRLKRDTKNVVDTGTIPGARSPLRTSARKGACPGRVRS